MHSIERNNRTIIFDSHDSHRLIFHFKLWIRFVRMTTKKIFYYFMFSSYCVGIPKFWTIISFNLKSVCCSGFDYLFRLKNVNGERKWFEMSEMNAFDENGDTNISFQIVENEIWARKMLCRSWGWRERQRAKEEKIESTNKYKNNSLAFVITLSSCEQSDIEQQEMEQKPVS